MKNKNQLRFFNVFRFLGGCILVTTTHNEQNDGGFWSKPLPWNSMWPTLARASRRPLNPGFGVCAVDFTCLQSSLCKDEFFFFSTNEIIWTNGSVEMCRTRSQFVVNRTSWSNCSESLTRWRLHLTCYLNFCRNLGQKAAWSSYLIWSGCPYPTIWPACLSRKRSAAGSNLDVSEFGSHLSSQISGQAAAHRIPLVGLASVGA